ncbi:MAG: ATP-dependent DNA helicase RecG [Bacilli bacterium]|nr:ATP-dependent DNA helicase RecG [Bacilli bacterium]
MLDEIKGIGPKTILSLNSLGIYTLDDLLNYFPYRYNVLKPVSLSTASDDDQVLINGYIENPIKVFFIKKNLNKLSFKLNTGTELINVTIFNRSFIKPNLSVGKQISVLGKYNRKNNTFVANDIKLVPILRETIEPVYHLNAGLKRSSFIKIMDNALSKNYFVTNNIPDYLMNKYKFVDKMVAIKDIHKPINLQSIKDSKLMLIYEELFTFMLKMNYLKLNQKNVDEFYERMIKEDKVNKFIETLPFTLTNDQVNAIEEIKNDFNNPKRMNRLILGDVGSGKTIVAFIALYMNYITGYQGVMMAPTEILAKQHYENMINLFKNFDLKMELLTSSTLKKTRSDIIKRLASGDVDVLIGTHSLLNDEIIFKNLGLVVTDEQHRFGVNQRNMLQKKGRLSDVLYLSATPIPRTLALTLFGDMDITEIKSKPSNRKPIETKLFKNKDIKDVLFMMLDEIKKGHQIYVVAPLIEDENETGMETVKELKNKIDTAFNHKIPIDILHGKLKNKDKEEIMNNFKLNKTKILISTTVIEVGVDVKNATMMVIFNAERFGLATLHQLRGRIGRNDLESKCILISDYDTPRLKILEESNDGFYISEKDFELRGSGDLFGVKQSGDMDFKIANMKTDFKILQQCALDSKEFLENVDLNKYPIQKNIIDSISFMN